MEKLGFAFNNFDFSDMALHIEIVSERSFLWPWRSVKVITLNISSRILASESHYFSKLFEDVTKESDSKEVTLKINASEVAALMDLLNFMYINNLSATTPSELEDVRMMAEKLEVTSCMKYVQKLAMSPQHELLNGEPSLALMAEEVQPLKDAAKKYLIDCHKDLIKSRKEAMALPLSVLEIVLGSPGIRVGTEDGLYHFIMEWSDRRGNYHLSRLKRLFRFIHFPYLSPTAYYYLSQDYKLLEAIFSNDGRHTLKITRTYKYHPIKVVHCSGSPLTRSVVYFDLTKQELENLSRSKQQYSRVFNLGDQAHLGLALIARCNKLDPSSPYHFGLFVCASYNATVCIRFGYEFGVLKKKMSDQEYEIMSVVNDCTLSEAEGKFFVGEKNLFGISWDEFMAEDSEYFFDGILHLRVVITLHK